MTFPPLPPEITPGDKPNELRLFEHGFVRLDAAMADDLSVINSARVSFAVRKEEMDDRDKGLIRFLMRDRHGSPFEHNSMRFHIRTPIFVAREWFRHRIGCLTGDTVVSVENINGSATRQNSKTMDELWEMWSEGEHNPTRLAPETEGKIREMHAKGMGKRLISRQLRVGRQTITKVLAGASTQKRDARWRVRRMRVRVLNEETGHFTSGHIAEVFDKGLQPVYRVTLADGKTIDMTTNHQVLTPDGWTTLGIAAGLEGDPEEPTMTKTCHLMVNGMPVYRDRGWMGEQRRAGRSVTEMAADAGCSYHTIRAWLRRHGLQFTPQETRFKKGQVPWNKDHKGYKLDRAWTEEQKDAIRAARSGEKSNFWRGGVSSARADIGRWTREQAPKVHAAFDYTCQSCGERSGRLHAHHIVPVWRDITRARDIGNLATVCQPCHVKIHATRASEMAFMKRFAHLVGSVTELQEVPQRKGFRLMAHPVQVVSIAYIGVKQTYDLAIEGPWHNFVANGVVVHNSFNEESARYHKLSDDFYVPSPEAVRSQVGKPGSYSFEPVGQDLAGETIDTFRRIYKELYAEYQGLIEKGVAKELARAVLPFGIFTQFYWTLNARSLMNFLSLRNASAAQYEIRIYAAAVEHLWSQAMPETHASFVEFGRTAP